MEHRDLIRQVLATGPVRGARFKQLARRIGKVVEAVGGVVPGSELILLRSGSRRAWYLIGDQAIEKVERCIRSVGVTVGRPTPRELLENERTGFVVQARQ